MSNESVLLQLGNTVAAAICPEDAVLERVSVQSSGGKFVARFTCPEFTSLCPVTGQPDFAHIVIDYEPDIYLLESKSLKLFLQSFRNHGAFHESCTTMIGDRIYTTVEPKWIQVSAFWYPRGGIPIDVFWVRGEKSQGAYVHPVDVPMFRGRG